MRLTASDFNLYHQPSRCELRLFLRSRGTEESPPGPFQEVLRSLGERHERLHLERFEEVVDLSSGTIEERVRRTRQEVENRVPAIYQPVLRGEANLGGTECEIIGEPDFLLREEPGYVVRDCKISLRITEADHPEILRQLELYGWLYEQAFGCPPVRLEVFSGSGNIEPLDYDQGEAALAELAEILGFMQSESEPFSPVGWSKCQDCGYRPLCWPRAEEGRDVALVVGVDQGLARALRGEGISSYDELLDTFDETTLAEFRRPWGRGLRKVGKNASAILRMAEATASGRELVLHAPEIPNSPNYVMFDLEGLPPYLDETEKIYLWGMQVFGDHPSEFLYALAGFEEDGDRDGWNRFLANAAQVFSEHGNIPFVHWHDYEKNKLALYVERFGDSDGVADRVKGNLLNLLPITRDSIVMPIPSYSLKVVESYIGFQRTQDEYGGQWAMAKYIEAVESEDETLRDEVIDKILVYNREDLEATWAVLQWLKSKKAS